VTNLVWNVFEEFEAPGYKQEGIDEFKKFILPENIATLCNNGQFFVLHLLRLCLHLVVFDKIVGLYGDKL
jgi:hypothetical protein